MTSRKNVMALLEVRDLQVRVDEREILHALSLTVNEGEVHAIMGAERLRQVDAVPRHRRQARL